MAILLWCYLAGRFDTVAVLVFVAGFFSCVLLVILPVTLPVGVKASVAVGAALVGTALMWGLGQIESEFRNAQLAVPLVIASVAHVLATRWVRSRSTLAQSDAQSANR